MSEIFVIDGLVVEGWLFGNLTVGENTTGGTVRKEILGAKARHEKTKIGDDTLEISGKIAPKTFGGLQHMSYLQSACRDSMPVYVTRGGVNPMGWFIVTNISNGHRHIDVDGTGRLVDFSIQLEATESPSALGIVSTVLNRITSIIGELFR
ncbi:phage tail protein [uncultured Cohaesibacter sp.]|uniref:phage tail protein n=1 Tax=uncultured Cohaesibacter sp. TaxID=1002546 RepID=UPI0029C89F6E|nr:phage tail protein [uncultured Cohaesibacter sp.]